MQIVLLVDKDGKTQTIVKGVAGSSCTKKSEFLTNALGTITKDTLTDEYQGIQLFDTNTVQSNQPVRRVQQVKIHN